MAKTKHGKCPHCCPQGGAILTATYDDHGPVWHCNNCGVEQPRRTNKPTAKITPSQQEVLDILASYGWSLETKFIGRDVWVVGRKDRGSPILNVFSGDSFFGSIGPRGAFKLTLQKINEKVMTDRIDLKVYLA